MAKTVKAKRGAPAAEAALAEPAAASAPNRVAQVLQDAVERGDLAQTDLDLAMDKLGLRRTESRYSRDRRQDIIGAAIRIFSQKGYYAATLQEIADELGLTRPAFYYYFKSKQEILEAICRSAADGTDRAIETSLAQPSANDAEALRRVLVDYAEHIAGQDTTAIMMRNFEETSPDVQREIAARRRAREDNVLAVLKRGVAGGEFATPQAHIAIITAFEAIHAIANWYHPDGPRSRHEIAEIVADILLNGLLTR